MITENLSTLKIHKLSQEQYERERDANRLDKNALYLTPDENIFEEIINEKQNKITGTAGQFVVIGDDGNPTAKTIPFAEEATFGV